MTPASRVRVGDYEAVWVRDSSFAVDAGTMFNTVPRVLWQRCVAPDAQNRAHLGLNCLVLRGEGRTILADAGVGNKLPEKQRRNYALRDDLTLAGELANAGIRPEEIDTVVLTHLHLDHAGWLTHRAAGGELVPMFPRARHVVQKAEWHAAHHPNELTQGSYKPDDFDPIERAGLLDLVEGNAALTPAVRVELSAGHTQGHQMVRLDSGGQVLVFPCEIVPSSWHMRVAWVTSYDLDTYHVVEVKRRVLREAAEHRHIVFLTHDPDTAFGYVERRGDREYSWKPIAAS